MIAANVRTLRRAKGIQQQVLARTVGITKSYLSHIEAGRRTPTPDMTARLADALDASTEELTGTPSSRAEWLAGLLAEHREAEVETPRGWVMACDCGWDSRDDDHGDEAYSAHLAAVLDAALTAQEGR